MLQNASSVEEPRLQVSNPLFRNPTLFSLKATVDNRLTLFLFSCDPFSLNFLSAFGLSNASTDVLDILFVCCSLLICGSVSVCGNRLCYNFWQNYGTCISAILHSYTKHIVSDNILVMDFTIL